MNQNLIEQVEGVEQYAGQPLPYLHELAEHNPEGFTKFMQFLPLPAHGAAADVNHLSIARLSATQFEDCGTCLQINVDLALANGAERGVIQAVLDRDPQSLQNHLQREVYSYCQSVLSNAPELSSQLAGLKTAIGETAVTDLAMAIASTRVFPILKRAMGHAQSCSRVQASLPAEALT